MTKSRMVTLTRRHLFIALAATVLPPFASPALAAASAESIAAMIARGEPVARIEQAFAERVRAQHRQRGPAGYDAAADIRSIIAAARRLVARRQKALDAQLAGLRSKGRGSADISGTGGVLLVEKAKEQMQQLASNITSIETAMTQTAKSVERKMNQ